MLKVSGQLGDASEKFDASSKSQMIQRENIVKVNDLAKDTVDDVQDNACIVEELNTMALYLRKSLRIFKI
ncbi:hypothetical protein A6E05_02805 [Aliivibrio sp. 1S165]|nr:hypothetical protein A6E05_02805 [Aliivibrio sp. 1S165]OCH32772.1 hypothetical protein A6E06_01660 [Aliivibrio sp. 1S175]